MGEPTPNYGRRADDWAEAVLESVRPNGSESLVETWRIADQMADDLWETVLWNGMGMEVEDIVPCVIRGVPVVRVSMPPCKVRRLMELAKWTGFRAQETPCGPPEPDGSRNAA